MSKSSILGLRALEVAREEMAAGAREIGGNNRGPFVEKYLKRTGLRPPQPWCAAFVSWCLHEAAARLKARAPLPYTAGARALLTAGRRLGLTVASPLPGDIVVWSRGNPQGPFGHTGIVARVAGGRMSVVEGNRTDRVHVFNYSLADNSQKVLGYIRM